MSAVGATGPVDGRTVWWGKDAAWWRRERQVTLGEEFGTPGPAVIDWLSCEAKLQNAGGYVKAGPRAVARGIFADAVTVSHVLSRAVEIGSLQDYAEHEGIFSCYVSGWDSDQRRADAAARQAAARARKHATSGNPDGDPVTGSHAESRSVTKDHVKGEERREENNDLTDSLREPVGEHVPGGEHAPIPIERARDDREQVIFDAWVQATGRTPSTVFDEKRRAAIRKALKFPKLTFEDVLGAARGVRHSEHHLQNKQWSELRVVLRDVAQIENFRDLERQHTGIPVGLVVADHPCVIDDAAIDEWNEIVTKLPDGVRVLLEGSHPHAGSDDDAFLIGVRPDYAATLAGRSRANAHWLGALTNGCRVEFLPCPQLERNAA